MINTPGGFILKIREIIKIIEEDGWYLVATKGSHRQYKHPEKPGRITIAGHLDRRPCTRHDEQYL
jgi:predicted RNA binding protein YcfA (HicA-like mRNA interferase family)